MALARRSRRRPGTADQPTRDGRLDTSPVFGVPAKARTALRQLAGSPSHGLWHGPDHPLPTTFSVLGYATMPSQVRPGVAIAEWSAEEDDRRVKGADPHVEALARLSLSADTSPVPVSANGLAREDRKPALAATIRRPCGSPWRQRYRRCRNSSRRGVQGAAAAGARVHLETPLLGENTFSLPGASAPRQSLTRVLDADLSSPASAVLSPLSRTETPRVPHEDALIPRAGLWQEDPATAVGPVSALYQPRVISTQESVDAPSKPSLRQRAVAFVASAITRLAPARERVMRTRSRDGAGPPCVAPGRQRHLRHRSVSRRRSSVPGSRG